MSLDWFRHSNGMSTDAKLTFIAKKCGARRCEVTAVWSMLLEHASAHADRGYVGDIDLEFIASCQDIDIEIVKKLFVTLHTQNSVTCAVTENGYLKAWNRYNGVTKKKAMTSAERVRKHRENKKKESNEDVEKQEPDVTQCNESNDVTPQDKTRHLVTSSLTNVSSEVSPPAPKPEKMFFDFLPLDWKAWALTDRGWTEEIVNDVWAQFRDYWRDGKGKNTKRADWLPTWRTWCRKENIQTKTKSLNFEQQARNKTDQAVEEVRKRYADPS